MGRIIKITYGGDQSDKIKIQLGDDQSLDGLEQSLREFKLTDTYKGGEWSDDDLLEHLESDAIEFEFIEEPTVDETIALTFL